MRVLVIEDDPDVAAQVGEALERAGYLVDLAKDGEEGKYFGETKAYDAIVLDLGLPVIDGLSVLTHWRQDGLKTPVLVLSARSTWRDKVQGLRGGADDYLAKPFELEEVVARVDTIIRRAAGQASSVIAYGEVSLDTDAKRISLGGRPLKLTAMEYRVLSILMHRRGKVVSKADLSDRLYGPEADAESNTIEVLVNRLRGKLGDNLIATHRGHGYQFGAPDEPAK